MNPFNYISIAQGDSFYDRKEETERIVATLKGGNNIVLFAPRRYGKTSLVFKAMEQLEAQGVACAYMDLMPVYSLESFAELYLQALYKKLTVFERFIRLVSSLKNIRPKLTFDNSGKPQFGVEFSEPKVSVATISDLLELPEKMAQDGKRIVVVMDEFQEIRKLEKSGLEALLRSKIQLQHSANYLFLGSKTHIMQDMFMAKNRPFYNSALTIQISPLPESDTIGFLTDRFARSGIRISEDNCRHLIRMADNIPYYIQLLAAEVWQYMVPDMHEVRQEVIDECFERVVELKRDYYFERYDRLAALQKRLLQALSVSGENIYSADYIARHRLAGASSVQKAVAVLQDEGLIEKNDSSFFFADPFFRHYIRNYAVRRYAAERN